MALTLFTPTYARDYERFALLRESIERCGITFRHVAVVNPDDLPLFKSLPHQNNLSIVLTSDVLPAAIERRRVAFIEGRSPPRWLRRFVGRPMQGWYAQQFIKLAAPAVVSDDLILCVDSDTLFLRNVTLDDFIDHATGRPHLYESHDDVDAEMAEWLGRSMRFLGVRPTGRPISRFIHSPTLLRRDVLLDLCLTIEQRHKRPWFEAFDPYDSITEYTTYGVFAKYVDKQARVTCKPPDLSLYFWWPNEVNRMATDLPQTLRASSAKMMAVQSNVGVEAAAYAEQVRAVWDDAVPAAVAHPAGLGS